MMTRRITYLMLTCLLISGVANAEGIRFAVLGDCRGGKPGQAVNNAIFSKIVQDIVAATPPVQFVIVTGDLVKGSKTDSVTAGYFQEWRQLAQPWYDANYMGSKVYVVPGNHDEVNSSSYLKVWQNAFLELPDNGPNDDKKMTYSFDAGPCHFAIVNTSIPNLLRAHTVDLDWLSNDLANSDKPIKLVIGHEPAYPYQSHIGSSLDAKPAKRDQFWKLLVENNVQAYFCGHIHSYDHAIKDNVHQIITGGGGAPGSPYHYLIVDADDEVGVTVSVYYEEGNTLHEQYKLSDTQEVRVIQETSASDSSLSLNSLSCPLGVVMVLVGMFFSIGIVRKFCAIH
jgi:DNA repair exonuclease SbcCD nuclease subunit